MFDPAPQTISRPKVPEPDIEVRDLLIKARFKIAKRRQWCQHYYRVKRAWWKYDSYCLIGAIEFSSRNENDQRRAVMALGFADKSSAMHWNDRHDRAHAEVVARFDHAIARASGEILERESI